MFRLSFLFLPLLLVTISYAQKRPPKKFTAPPLVINEYAATDKAALQIPDSVTSSSAQLANYISSRFHSDKERIRVAFVWIAGNIRYDYKNMYRIGFSETKEEKIAKPLASHKGICENYAHLFQDVLSHCGISAYVVEGYTRQGVTIDRIPHAWSAVRLNGVWAFYDPTWASSTSIKTDSINGTAKLPYYQVTPELFTRSHMPFDYLWQLSHYPINRTAFFSDNTSPDLSQAEFHFEDTLLAYQDMDSIDQLTSAMHRIQANGPMNDLCYEYLMYTKRMVSTTLYNRVVLSGNRALNLLNAFIDYRNHRFRPARPDAEIQGMIDSAGTCLNLTRVGVAELYKIESGEAQALAEYVKWMDGVDKQIEEQKGWLKRYFAPGKLFRPLRFQ